MSTICGHFLIQNFTLVEFWYRKGTNSHTTTRTIHMVDVATVGLYIWTSTSIKIRQKSTICLVWTWSENRYSQPQTTFHKGKSIFWEDLFAAPWTIISATALGRRNCIIFISRIVKWSAIWHLQNFVYSGEISTMMVKGVLRINRLHTKD